jgi:hypothetical protein
MYDVNIVDLIAYLDVTLQCDMIESDYQIYSPFDVMPPPETFQTLHNCLLAYNSSSSKPSTPQMLLRLGCNLVSMVEGMQVLHLYYRIILEGATINRL